MKLRAFAFYVFFHTATSVIAAPPPVISPPHHRVSFPDILESPQTPRTAQTPPRSCLKKPPPSQPSNQIIPPVIEILTTLETCYHAIAQQIARLRHMNEEQLWAAEALPVFDEIARMVDGALRTLNPNTILTDAQIRRLWIWNNDAINSLPERVDDEPAWDLQLIRLIAEFERQRRANLISDMARQRQKIVAHLLHPDS